MPDQLKTIVSYVTNAIHLWRSYMTTLDIHFPLFFQNQGQGQCDPEAVSDTTQPQNGSTHQILDFYLTLYTKIVRA